MSDRPTFSVIVPTRGRRSLRGTLASIAEQLEDGDELLVLHSTAWDFGNASRQSMVERARGTHLVFMDDDDQFARGAFATMRRFAAEHPGRIGIFRMRYPDGTLLWRDPELRRKNVSSQMLCVPNVPGKLGRWDHGQHRDADWRFIDATVALQGEPVFRQEVVALFRDDRRRLGRLAMKVTRPLDRLRFKAAPRTRVRRALGR